LWDGLVDGGGNISAPKGGTDVWVAKLNAEGLILWEKSYGGSDFEEGRKILPLENGQYMVAGYTSSSDQDVGYNHGSYDAWVFVIDANGRLLWQRTFGTPQGDSVSDICQLSDGKFVLATNSLIKFVLTLE